MARTGAGAGAAALALTLVDDATPPSVEARIHLGLGMYYSGGERRRHSHNLRAIELLRQVGNEPVLLGHALAQAGSSSSSYRDVTEAEQYHDEALLLLRRRGRTKWLGFALNAAGSMRRDAGDLQTSRALTEEALALAKALGDVRLQDACENNLAAIAFAAGRMVEAIDRARRAVHASRRHGTLTIEFLALHSLAAFLILDDQIESGRAKARRAFELSRALGNVGLPSSMYQLALVLAMRGEADTAVRLAGFADGYADQHQLAGADIAVAIRSRLFERLHCAMSLEECQIAMAAGAAWSEREAVAVAESA